MELIEDDLDWNAYESAPELDKVIRASTLTDSVIDVFYGSDDSRGDYLPWPRFADKFRLRKSEVTLYAGVNGHGKTKITNQVALGTMRQDERALVAGMEMTPTATMASMCCQASGSATPSIAFIRNFHSWTDGRLWIYNHHGDVRAERLLAVLRYAASKLNVSHVFIDSLMKCVRGTDDYNGQKDFVNSLCDFALTTLAHVHLVAHVRKGDKQTDEFDKFSIKGASEISDLVDNVILIKRNKRKEMLLEQGKFTNDMELAKVNAEPDCFLDIDKQRHFSWEGRLGLWYDSASGSFVESCGERVRPQDLSLRDVESDAERLAIAGEAA